MSRRKGKSDRFVALRYLALKSDAWKSLPVGARALYIEIAQRYNGSDNGRITYAVREAVQSLRISQGTASHLLHTLEERGFIVCTSAARSASRRRRTRASGYSPNTAATIRPSTPGTTSCGGSAP
jgi:DNA-binding MarR family transcriptional regulator